MSGSINKVILLGYTGTEIQMHFFENEDCVGRVPLATNETFKDKHGQKTQTTDWHNLIFRNAQAKAIEQYAPKGTKLFIEGRTRTRKWQDNAGNDRYTTEVLVKKFLFIDKKPEPKNQNEREDLSQDNYLGTYSETGNADILPF